MALIRRFTSAVAPLIDSSPPESKLAPAPIVLKAVPEAIASANHAIEAHADLGQQEPRARRERGATRPDGKAIDFYQEMTDRIVEGISSGIVPWRQNAEDGQAPGWPSNGTTSRLYHGINVPMLMSKGFADDRWATFNQAKAEGWNVRRGERGSKIYFHLVSEREIGVDEATSEPIKRRFPHLRSFTVFNFAQIDGAPQRELRQAPTSLDDVNAGHIDDMVAAMGIDASDDLMPRRTTFESTDRYYEALLRQAIHWTAHPDRMNRVYARDTEHNDFVRELLRADIAMAMLCSRLGVVAQSTVGPEKAQRFIDALTSDKKEVYRASRDAEHIVNFMLVHHPEYSEALKEEAKAVADDAVAAGFPDEFIDASGFNFDDDFSAAMSLSL